MRVTNNMMTNSIVRYLSDQNKALFERQTIIASQKRLNKPSDDPLGMGNVLSYRQTLDSIEQYQKNIETGKTRVEITETTLDLADEFITMIRGIARVESDGTTESRLKAADSVKSLFDQVLNVANTKFNDNYMFSGNQTKTAPFSRDDTLAATFDKYTVTYNGDDGDVQIIIAENTVVGIDADGQPIFHDAASGGINTFDVMRDLIVGLENDDTTAISNQVDLLDQASTQLDEIRSANMSIINQLQTTEKYWMNYKPKMEQLLSKAEAADITKAVIELQAIELAYESTIATAASIMQPGLVQFLK
jgi:flagellar hook-associated protein 3 FlgL